eukprot:c32329_g1_i1 orf=246-539(-)
MSLMKLQECVTRQIDEASIFAKAKEVETTLSMTVATQVTTGLPTSGHQGKLNDTRVSLTRGSSSLSLDWWSNTLVGHWCKLHVGRCLSQRDTQTNTN